MFRTRFVLIVHLLALFSFSSLAEKSLDQRDSETRGTIFLLIWTLEYNKNCNVMQLHPPDEGENEAPLYVTWKGDDIRNSGSIRAMHVFEDKVKVKCKDGSSIEAYELAYCEYR